MDRFFNFCATEGVRGERFWGLQNSLTRLLHRIEHTTYEFGKFVIVMHSSFDTYIVLRKSFFAYLRYMEH